MTAAGATAPAPLSGRDVAVLLCGLGEDAAAGVVAAMVDELAAVPLRLAQLALAYAGPDDEAGAGEPAE